MHNHELALLLGVAGMYQRSPEFNMVYKPIQSEAEKQDKLAKAELKRQRKNAKRLRNKNV